MTIKKRKRISTNQNEVELSRLYIGGDSWYITNLQVKYTDSTRIFQDVEVLFKTVDSERKPVFTNWIKEHHKQVWELHQGQAAKFDAQVGKFMCFGAFVKEWRMSVDSYGLIHHDVSLSMDYYKESKE